ncbi:GNAT family N-acetyltransferase [Streptomyces sp. NPDC002073]|uniref:GNAT family N-acetyltransferase n=1 Tax=Streptomyces sp. NBC_00239 TaxID=2903640 RepID=UPI002E299B8A|nr:GNAT family protein [Streptomyces sp. NBC_00239]
MRDHVKTPSGLLLRRWEGQDAPSVMKAFADPLMRGQSAEAIDSLEAAERWISDWTERWESGTAFAFAVVDGGGDGRGDGAVLGNVAVSAVNRRHGTGWVSYWTTSSARGRGVATQACRTVSRWAFDDAGLFRLELGHRIDNPGSCKVATASGFAVEGYERQKLEYDGVRYDAEAHARLATDPEPLLPR